MATPISDFDVRKFIEVYTNNQWTVVDTFSDYSVKMSQVFFSGGGDILRAPISQDIDLPWTEKNEILFGVSKTNPSKVPDLDFRITDGTNVLFTGRLRVDGFRWNGLNNLIKVQLEDKLAYAIREMNRLNMSEFISDTENENTTDSDGYRHYLETGVSTDAGTINQLNEDSDKFKYIWQDTINSGDEKKMYGLRPDFNFDSSTGTQSLQPAFNVKNIVESAFSRVGLNISSDFFDDATYMDDVASSIYPATKLFMTLPFYARTRGAWTPSSTNPIGNSETYNQRRTFSFNVLYKSFNYVPFGTGRVDKWGSTPTTGNSWSFLNANVGIPSTVTTQPSTSNDHPINIVSGYLPYIDDSREVMVFSRPCRYDIDMSPSDQDGCNIRASKISGATNPQLTPVGLLNSAGAPTPQFYWEMIFRKTSGESKSFRVSPLLNATSGTYGNGSFTQWSVPSTNISMQYTPEEDRFIDINTGDGIEVFLVLKAAESNRMEFVNNVASSGNREVRGAEMNDNSFGSWNLYVLGPNLPVGDEHQIDLSPRDEYFPCYYQEDVDVKYSLQSQYPDMKLWDLVDLVFKRFNLQAAYNIQTDSVEIENIYRNKWLPTTVANADVPFVYAHDNSEFIEAEVRTSSIREVSAVNATFGAVGDKDFGTEFPVASTNSEEFDPDGDEVVNIKQESGVLTGIVHGEIKKGFDPYNSTTEFELAGVTFAEEVDVEGYGIRFGFLGNTTDVNLRFPRPLPEEGITDEWPVRESYLPTSQPLNAHYCDYRRVYYDGPDVDFIVSCGMENGSNSGSDDSAYELFHRPMLEIIANNAKLTASFILNIDTLSILPFGTVIDFGYGSFGILSISDVEVMEGETKAEIVGYLL